MKIEVLDDNNIEIGMKRYIQDAIDSFDEDVYTKVLPPANKDLH